jgi:hypothetical protein
MTLRSWTRPPFACPVTRPAAAGRLGLTAPTLPATGPALLPQTSEWDHRLANLAPLGTWLRREHRGGGDAADRARQELAWRYSGAAYRYLLAVAPDPQAAADLAEAFAQGFAWGRFRGADPGGPVRDYVQAALFRLVDDHFGRPDGPPTRPARPPAAAFRDAGPANDERAFVDGWRQELLAWAWRRLSTAGAAAGQPYYVVLRLGAERPQAQPAELAAELSARLGRPLTAADVRRLSRRARARFAALLLDEARQSLGGDAARLEEELAELNLLTHGREAPACGPLAALAS